MKIRGYEEVLEPERLFVFMMQYCSNKSKALEAAKLVITKLKDRGRKSYSGIFENVDQLIKYAEAL